MLLLSHKQISKSAFWKILFLRAKRHSPRNRVSRNIPIVQKSSDYQKATPNPIIYSLLAWKMSIRWVSLNIIKKGPAKLDYATASTLVEIIDVNWILLHTVFSPGYGFLTQTVNRFELDTTSNQGCVSVRTVHGSRNCMRAAAFSRVMSILFINNRNWGCAF